ncbi:hypothetical protein K505DRAFT_328268 [Melanomma pulvis-pyrius CBS 109.77]|uniref:Uncharacterized protein n=1 Tax=Melanomma pulvis-pyrius CBS 109.77 TaxID=1314802 RepID=A0A6A6WZR7_9PLEO|nr:hypothetical protein K505DRAFT_328268 [Melanomma pulvis-pyrius CBS 109.77]
MRKALCLSRTGTFIVDWAFGGWYPEYWEYTTAHYGLMNIPDWYSEFGRAMP